MNKIPFKTLVFLLVMCAGIQNTFAQTSVELHITHMLGGTTLFNKDVVAANDLGDQFKVTRLQYYISKISITHDGGTVTDIADHYLLVDAFTDVKDVLGSYNITNLESISFHIGVDTPNNHADPSLQPSGHPLAPKFPSMHWGWADGYRFSALEGVTGSQFDQVFQIHSLGDDHYYQTTVTTTGMMQSGKLIIPLYADYSQMVKGVNITAGMYEHGNATIDTKVLNNFKDNVFKPGYPVSVQQTVAALPKVRIYPNPAVNGMTTIAIPANTGAKVTITDIQGRTVQTQSISGNKADIRIAIPGLYFVKTTMSDGTHVTNKLLVQ